MGDVIRRQSGLDPAYLILFQVPSSVAVLRPGTFQGWRRAPLNDSIFGLPSAAGRIMNHSKPSMAEGDWSRRWELDRWSIKRTEARLSHGLQDLEETRVQQMNSMVKEQRQIQKELVRLQQGKVNAQSPCKGKWEHGESKRGLYKAATTIAVLVELAYSFEYKTHLSFLILLKKKPNPNEDIFIRLPPLWCI